MRHRSEESPGSGYVLNPTPECGLPKPEAQSLVVLCLLCSEFVRKLMRVTTPECLFGRARERRSALRRGETIGWVQTMQPISQWPSARTVGAGGSHGGHGEMRGVQRGVGIGPTGIEREDKIGSGIRLGAGAAHGAGVGRRGQHGDRDEQAAGLVMLAEQLARPCRLTCLQSTTSSQSFAIRPAALSSARDRLSRQPPQPPSSHTLSATGLRGRHGLHELDVHQTRLNAECGRTRRRRSVGPCGSMGGRSEWA